MGKRTQGKWASRKANHGVASEEREWGRESKNSIPKRGFKEHGRGRNKSLRRAFG